MLKYPLFPLFITALLGISGCDSVAPTEEFPASFTQMPETERLRYFKEIGMTGVRDRTGLTGKGVSIIIMNEVIDASHPDLKNRIYKQYNVFANQGTLLTGEGNQPYYFNKLGMGDGHGTHIAGTIVAECDTIALQGVACGASLDAYFLSPYDHAEDFPSKGWGKDDEMTRFLKAFSKALDNVSQQGKSKIITGSFNQESPMIRYQNDSLLAGKSLNEMIIQSEKLSNLDELFDKKLAIPQNPKDKVYLKQLAEKYDDQVIALGSLLPLTSEWSALENSLQKYQKTGGVYLITESNIPFGRTSVINAMPSLSNKVDADLWLSVVMVQPKGIEAAKTQAGFKQILDKAEYITPINHCGKTAASYCILTPSYDVLSTMTEKVREAEAPLYKIQERFHQSFSGHSMGAPMVAGALALMQELNQQKKLGYSMKDLVRILKQSANRTFKGYNPDKHGQGILDIGAALKQMEKK